MYFNCRSLLPKIDELAALCIMNMPDVVCLAETWLCTDTLDTEIFIPNYSIVRLDRNRHGGGFAMYIKNSVSYNVVLYDSTGLEVIVVSLSKSNFKLCLRVFYRPHLLFLIICVTFYSLLSSQILYYLVTLMLIF